MGRPDWSSWFVLLAILGCSPLPAASALSFRSLLGTRSPLVKRALPVDGDGLEIPLYKDSLGRYVASISMGNQEKVGATIQNFSFVLSTSSPYTAVAGAKCAACISEVGSSSLYNDTISQTEVPLNNTQSLVIGDNQVKGDTISEACAFVQRNGSLWWYPDQTVMVASESQNFFANGAAGLIGLGRSSGKDSFIDTVFRDHAGWNTLLIGLAFEDVPATTTSSDPTGGKAAVKSSNRRRKRLRLPEHPRIIPRIGV
ncbi:hypothetical protein FRC20_004638 [Serendipita sp. 405]|nr:hypothetical protein FRC20_004638 [Serendipita sp. 405]